MKVGKPTSKRVTVRLRQKIQKKSSAKQKKQRRDDKKNPQWRSRLKKDPGIPNLFPYKAQILAEIEESKRRKEEEQTRKKEEAKARRLGLAVADIPTAAGVAQATGGDEMLDDDEDSEDVDEDMEDSSSNPMAALLASAQARAQSFGNVDEDEDDEDDDEDEGGAWDGIQDERVVDPTPAKKGLPQQALDDPIKAITKLMERMQQTQDGIQRMLEYYQAPPMATAGTGTDVATRFLVEVARKRGRLGRGGVPNLHSSAMLVLNDLHEERLKLPALSAPVKKAKKATAGKQGEIKIVQTMAEPFKLEGLWGEEKTTAKTVQEMVVET